MLDECNSASQIDNGATTSSQQNESFLEAKVRKNIVK